MLATWRWTVCGLRNSCSAISWSLNPVATSASTSRSRRESSAEAGVSAAAAGTAGPNAERSARLTERQSPAHGKWAVPSSGSSVAFGIEAASSRPSA
jgi:hypothetical protein